MVKKEGRSVSEMMQEIFYMPTEEETVTHQRNFPRYGSCFMSGLQIRHCKRCV